MFFLFFSLSAQQLYYNERPEFLKANSIWAFGEGAGLDFNYDSILAFDTRQFSSEGTAAVSHPVSGKLLFYSNGGEVYNAGHRQMPNGDSLLGNLKIRSNGGYRMNINDYSSQQGVCIVPFVNDPQKYYLFSLSGSTSGGLKLYDTTENGEPIYGSLFYNVIDMTLDRGKGDIIPGWKNMRLDASNLSECMIAVPGNKCDVWLIVHGMSLHEFKAYHITEAGIDTIPVVSDHSGSGLIGAGYTTGWLAVSPDRHKLFLSSLFGGGALLADFDPETGRVLDVREIFKGQFYAGSFSPDNSKLYLNGRALPAIETGILQYDLSVNDSATIVSSKTMVAPGSFGQSIIPYGSTRLYDGMLYFGGGNVLSRINKPNLKGVACDVERNVIPLSDGAISYGNFNTEVVYSLSIPQYVQHDTVSCEASILLNGPDSLDVYVWDDGTVSPERIITESGTYWLHSSNFCISRTDTFRVEIGNPDAIIRINLRELSTTVSYSHYQWMLDSVPIPGAISDKYTAKQNGAYQVIVTDANGCIDTSDVYVVSNIDKTGIASSGGQYAISIYPNPAQQFVYIDAPFVVNTVLSGLEGKKIAQFSGVSTLDIRNLPKGLYVISLFDRAGLPLHTEKIVKID